VDAGQRRDATDLGGEASPVRLARQCFYATNFHPEAKPDGHGLPILLKNFVGREE